MDERSAFARVSFSGQRSVPAEEWPGIADALRLTIREWEVVVLTFQGLTRASVARELCISRHTVREYLERVHRKLDVNDRTQLLLRVIECRDLLREQENRAPQ